MYRQITAICISLLLLGPAAAAPGGKNSHHGRPFQQLSEKLDRNGAQLKENGAAINQAINGINENALIIHDIPELTVEAFGAGARRWVSPFWREAFASNLSANTNVNVLNLAGHPVDVCIIFYSADGTLMQVKGLVINNRQVGLVEFVGAGEVSNRGWVEVVAGDKVLVEGAISTSTRSAGTILGVRERTMTWYALPSADGIPQELCPEQDEPN